MAENESTENQHPMKNRIEAAIRARDSEKLQTLLIATNLHLTGQDQVDFRKTDDGESPILTRKVQVFLEETREEEYAAVTFYLGDGGKTRLNLMVDDDIVEVGLSFSEEASAYDNQLNGSIRAKWDELNRLEPQD